ncbi:magnesium and cobalt transport protein CorA [Acidihalobacter aeolianus]|uniref:Magnesium transport protein CorA n=1 Tax=Acidihalobacter aeolianus TaxID=2792603 RepID=A0A1D8K7K7_9GAMM|nr:magnesium/cobalt transporter CorA [Acidihalobacter aeolianus]AOV16949.1 magnesium and cobalt transport protein CorA [Acidihalobacter aeolianus]
MGFDSHRDHTRKVGSAPGTLVDMPVTTPARLWAVHYLGDDMTEYPDIDADAARVIVKKEGVTWIHIQGQPDRQLLDRLGILFDLHPLALEDVQTLVQRPKLDIYQEQLFAILNLPRWNGESVELEQFNLFIGEGYVLSIHAGEEEVVQAVRRRLAKARTRLRTHGTDYLFYALMDLVVDQAFPVLETFGEEVEALEEVLLERPSRDLLSAIYQHKRNLMILRRQLWPTREVVSQLMRGTNDEEYFAPDLQPFLQDLYDHTVHIMDLLETYRDIVASMLDVYLSSVSNRLNDIMRVLTMISTIFIPLTFIVGVYGMNFGNNTKSPWAMPELNWYYGYPLVWGVMLVIAAGMVVFFRRKGWLGGGR